MIKTSRASGLVSVVSLLLLLSSAPRVGASPSGPALNRGWTTTSIAVPPKGTDFGGVIKVVAGGPGLLALVRKENLATSPPSQHPALWTSSDGLSWHSVALDPVVFPDAAGVFDMAAGPHGIVMTGILPSALPSSAPATSVYWSSPDGEHWSRSNYPTASDGATINIRTLAAGPAGFVGVGRAAPKLITGQKFAPPVASVLTSTDGLTWQPVPGMQSAFANVELTGVVAGGPGWVLAGIKQTSTSSEAVSYTSRDGLTWSGPYPLPRDTGSNTSEVGQLFAGSGTLVALGIENKLYQGPVEKIWTSTDGEHWQTAEWQGRSGALYMTSIASLGGLLVGLGSMFGVTTLWTSSDRLHWTQAADDRAFERSWKEHAGIQNIVSFQSGIVAIGSVVPVRLSCRLQPTEAPSLSAWRWTPERSQSAPPPPRPSPVDPRTFNLGVSDLPPGWSGYLVGYIPLCDFGTRTSDSFSSTLGKYSAYWSNFYSQRGQELVDSTTIVAASGTAAHAALLRAPAYFSPAYGHPGKPKEHPMTTRIGTEARLFATHALTECEGCPPPSVPASGVIWRRGRDIGIVVVYVQWGRVPNGQVRADAFRFAAAQDAHLRAVLGSRPLRRPAILNPPRT